MSIGSPAEKRLRKELINLISSPTPGLNLDADAISKNINEWIVEIEGTKESLYEGLVFQLKFKFTHRYPFEAPAVVFIGQNIPEHTHVYSNGHICLSILSDDWTPALSVQSVCLSILSMLSSATKRERPPDDLIYTKTCSKDPKKTQWSYHDDNV